MNAQREGDKAVFLTPRPSCGSHGDTNKNMAGDILFSKKVGYPTKPTDLDLWSGNHIPFYPQCPQMYSRTKKNVFNISRKNRWDNESEHLNQPEGLLNQIAGPPTPSLSDPVGQKWSLRICIFNEFSHDADAVIPETTLWEPQL